MMLNHTTVYQSTCNLASSYASTGIGGCYYVSCHYFLCCSPSLSLILLGMRRSWKVTYSTSTQLVYGETLWLTHFTTVSYKWVPLSKLWLHDKSRRDTPALSITPNLTSFTLPYIVKCCLHLLTCSLESVIIYAFYCSHPSTVHSKLLKGIPSKLNKKRWTKSSEISVHYKWKKL